MSSLVENLSCPVKGIVGPWVHKYPHFAVPEPRIGFLQEALRWWDHWLMGLDRGVENDAEYKVYLMDGVRPQTWYNHREGHWIIENDWPENIANSTWQFRADGVLSNLIKNNQPLGSRSAHLKTVELKVANIVQSGLAQKCREISKLMTQNLYILPH